DWTSDDWRFPSERPFELGGGVSVIVELIKRIDRSVLGAIDSVILHDGRHGEGRELNNPALAQYSVSHASAFVRVVTATQFCK
ncbi:MAG: hypothetical protein OXC63_05085, partial [Aestuariivita sp.]|nr:hypothetical protein [Aestuariivita sp.]